MDNKKMIIAITSLLLVCAVYLSWAEVRQADQNANKNWWALSFVDPKNSDVSFAIENHSDAEAFHYTVFTAGKTRLQESDVMIEKGASAKIDLSGIDVNDTEKIIIDVVVGKEKKEIYKNFKK